MIVLDGAGLSSDDVVAVAREGEAVQLDGAARARNAAARDSIAALLQRGEPLYGASTGVGALRDRVIAAEDREQLQWNLLRSHAVTAGPATPTRGGARRDGGPREPARRRRRRRGGRLA